MKSKNKENLGNIQGVKPIMVYVKQKMGAKTNKLNNIIFLTKNRNVEKQGGELVIGAPVTQSPLTVKNLMGHSKETKTLGPTTRQTVNEQSWAQHLFPEYGTRVHETAYGSSDQPPVKDNWWITKTGLQPILGFKEYLNKIYLNQKNNVENCPF